MRYADVESWVKTGLTNKGYGTAGKPAMPMTLPGPLTIHQLWQKTPNSLLFLQLGNGAGLAKEGLFTRPFIVVRAIGKQNDFESAETLAYDVDDLMLTVDGNTTMGSALTLFIYRTAGDPQLVDYDSAQRYHFQTTYIAETKR